MICKGHILRNPSCDEEVPAKYDATEQTPSSLASLVRGQTVHRFRKFSVCVIQNR